MADCAAMDPTISVVVPIYNVEPYLAPCLNSIASQSYSDLQVVMVDDGSTDGSAAIARDFASRDERFVLVQQENRGPGAARNTGTERATGGLLGFVDGDDLLPREAYALLHASLQASGSDLVTGVVRRFAPFGTWRTKLTPFRRTVRRSHIRDNDDLLMDRIVTNKLWRRSFWDKEGLRFPEGVLYEDVFPAFAGQVAAESADVLRDTVYWWRARSASTTQRRAVPHGVRDRVQAVRAVGEFMVEHGYPDLKRRYERIVLATELQQFLDVADQGTSEYRAALARHISEYLATVEAGVLEEIPAIQRLKYHLASRGLIDQLLDVLVFERTRLRDAPTTVIGDERFGVYPYFEDPRLGVPRSVYRLRTELVATCGIHRLRWTRRTLTLRGYAYINHVDVAARGAGEVTLAIRNRDTGATTQVRTRPVRDTEATLRAGQGAHRYDYAGFRATIDLSALDIPAKGEAAFDVEAVVRAGALERRTAMWRRTRSRVERAGRASLGDGRTIRAAFDLGSFTLKVEEITAAVTVMQKRDDALVIRGYLPRDSVIPKSLYLRRRVGAHPYRPNVVTLDDHGSGRREFRAKLTLAKLADRADAGSAGEGDEPRDEEHESDIPWRVRLRLEDDTDTRMVVDTRVPPTGLVHADREFTLHRTRNHNLGLTERRLRPVVTSARWRGATLVLAAEQARPGDDLRVILKRRGTGHERGVPAAVVDDGVRITLPLAAIPDVGEPRPLPRGRWDILIEHGNDAATRLPLRAHVDAIDRLESATVRGGRRYALEDVAYGRLAIAVSAARPQPRWQQLRELQRGPTLARRPPRSGLVVFSSWHGRRYAGDVRAIYDARPLQRGLNPVWVCHDAQFDVPGAAAVEPDTRAHVEALSRASCIVTDHLLPPWWHPAPNQRVIQTWHGTPVRRAGLDLPDDMARAARWCLAELRRQAAAWDVLVSASPGATEILRRTTGFDGNILETGAPRCDIHHREAERTARAAAVRKRLGIADGNRVVLWAPAPRDEGWTGRRRQNLGVDLHLSPVADTIDDDIVMLVHRHPAVARPPDDLAGALRDVTGVHDVADLLLVADVLVSDYSSVILDFLHTGKPVVLYMPDLEEFTERGPGLAIDLRQIAPGRVAHSSDAATQAISQALRDATPTSGYGRMLQLYGGPRDGHVTERLVQQLFDWAT
ncbi:MAG: glycosyltransferase [Nitriliruptorales bacterium]|nr:glycosyltransferase [Nitriliruptorales bacterium]